MDKSLYFEVVSTSLKMAVKYSCNAICLLDSRAFQAGFAVKELLKLMNHDIRDVG